MYVFLSRWLFVWGGGVDVVFKAWLETHPHAEENRQKPPKISIDVSQNSLKNLFPFMTLATQEKDYDDEERQKRNETRSTRREGERRLDRRIDSCGKEENRRDEDWNTDQTRHAEKEKEEAEKDEQHHSKSDTSKSFMVDEETDTTERSRKKKRTNSSSLSEEIMKNTKSVTHKSSLSSSSFSSSPLFHYYVFPSSPNVRCVWLKIHFNQIEKIFYKEEEDS